MAEQSKASKDLWLLRSADDFREHSLKLLYSCSRQIYVLSKNLDSNIYGQSQFLDLLSRLARSGSQVEIKFLVKDFKPAIQSGHPLIKLAQRLSSKIQLKKLTHTPENNDMGFMVSDLRSLLYQNDERVYQGFANYNAAAEIKKLRDEFQYLWAHAEVEKELQLLHI